MKDLLMKFFSLSTKEKLLLFEALIVLAFMRAAIFIFPFRYIASFLGQPERFGESSEIQKGEKLFSTKTIGWSVSTVARYTPWKSTCLAQAFSGKWMLRQRGIKSTIFIGVLPLQNELKAHAWLKAGDLILTGEREMEPYHVISTFS